MVDLGENLMVGESLNLSIKQISLLSGLSEREVHAALYREDLLDQSPRSVGEWLIGTIEGKLSKPKYRIGLRTNRESTVHRKWD